MLTHFRQILIVFSTFLIVCARCQILTAEEPLKLLFLGDNQAHRPADRFAQLGPVLAKRGIDLKYTDDVGNLNRETLNQFDGLVLYANIDRIEKPAADALLEYVADGNAFIPLHCATYCFRNDSRIVALMGAQFLRHGGEVFSTEIIEPKHPVMQGFGGFESWDETYVHHLHNEENRTVLEVRKQGMQAEGNDAEPWTWVRTHGDGRVFYTAWGHDQRTWSNPGFHNLVERGIRWACKGDPSAAGLFQDRSRFDVPEMTSLPENLRPFEYVEVGAKIPNYVPSNRWGVQGDPLTKMQLPLPAEESIKHFVTPKDFHVEIYATEDFTAGESKPKSYAGLVGKPIGMNWDERGRLWICETLDYPNELQPRNKGRDRIRICEDTDQDGQADKFTVFAEDLSIPTTLTFHRGGVIVQNGTETLWLKDTDGDDVADRREVIISNWNLVDTHGGVSNLRYGIDNWFWGMQGYNASEPIIAATGEKQPGFRMGFWRFRLDDSEPPVVTDLEFVRSTNNNTWGLGLSEEGLVFGSTANRVPSVFMPIPNRYYERVRGWGPEQLDSIADTYLFDPITDRVRQVDQHGGYTAGAGHALYTARNYPQQWWNKTAFVCGPTGKLVGTFVLKPNGSGFTSTSPFNLVASDDEWSAPIAAEVGPDGNVWFLDWYNYIVQHNPTPQGFSTGKGRAYESDLRDKKHGRIYRILYGEEDASSFPNLGGASAQELIDALSDSSMMVRLHAQRLLIERGDSDVISQLVELAKQNNVDEIGLDVGAMHAVGTLAGLSYFESQEGLEVLESALTHPSPGVRRVAVQSLPQDAQSIELISSLDLSSDPDPQVRLAAVLAVADQNANTDAGEIAATQFLDNAAMNDRWLADAVTSAAAMHAIPFLQSVAKSDLQEFSDRQAETLRIVAEHFSRGKPTKSDLEMVLAAINDGNSAVTGVVLNGLADGWQRDHQIKISDKLESSLVAILEDVPTSAKGRVIQLGTAWGSKQIEQYAGEIVDSLMEVITSDSKPVTNRVAAARQLVEFRSTDESIVESLVELIDARSTPDFSQGLLDALTASAADNVGDVLIDQMRAMTPEAKRVAMRVMLARQQTTVALLDGVEAGRLRLSDLSLDQQRVLTSHPDRRIRRRATEIMKTGGGYPNPDRQKVIEQLTAITHNKGDVELGKAMFVKHCSKCHKHGEIGEDIGPNLTGMVVHPKEELLVHILDPSRNVEGNFRLYTVVTNEGRIFSGMLAAETRTTVELVDTEAKRRTLARDDIDELLASPKSIMPEGFEKQMTPEELGNLLEFLTDKGKFIPVDLRKIASVVSSKPMFYGTSPAERLIFPDWKPKVFQNIPFMLVDPKEDQVPNVVMLFGPQGTIPPNMPRQVEFPVNSPAKRIHVLGGVGGWSFPAHRPQSTSAIVRFSYSDGQTEEHELKNGVHFGDYIRRVDVPESEFAFDLNGRQLRYLSIDPKRPADVIEKIELVKGNDPTAPIFVAITIESN